MNDRIIISSKTVKDLFPNDNPMIVEYMRIIISALEKIYNNNVPEELIIQLTLLRDLWKIYFKASAELAKGDLFSHGGNGRTYINPALQIEQNTYNQIIKACENLGVTVFSNKKVKIIDKKIGEESGQSANDLIKELLK